MNTTTNNSLRPALVTLAAVGLFTVGTMTCVRAQSMSENYHPQFGSAPQIVTVGESSTAGEGYMRGEADWMRGYGDSMRSQAEADYIEQIAIGKQIQNYERQRARIEARREAEAKVEKVKAEARRRATVARHRDEYVAAEALLPEIESTGGELNWPAALQKPQFEPDLQMISACLGRWVSQEHTLSRTDRNELRRSLEPLKTYLRRERLQNGSNATLAEARDLLQKIDTLVFSERRPMEGLAINQPRGK